MTYDKKWCISINSVHILNWNYQKHTNKHHKEQSVKSTSAYKILNDYTLLQLTKVWYYDYKTSNFSSTMYGNGNRDNIQ